MAARSIVFNPNVTAMRHLNVQHMSSRVSLIGWLTPRVNRLTPRYAHRVSSYRDDIEPVPPATLPSVTKTELEAEAQWVGDFIATWLDEEWTPLEVHRSLGTEVTRVYRELRSDGEPFEAGDVILNMAQELLAFNFKETFVGPFDVANKVVEILMLRAGHDVCCTSDSDREAVARSLDNA